MTKMSCSIANQTLQPLCRQCAGCSLTAICHVQLAGLFAVVSSGAILLLLVAVGDKTERLPSKTPVICLEGVSSPDKIQQFH